MSSDYEKELERRCTDLEEKILELESFCNNLADHSQEQDLKLSKLRSVFMQSVAVLRHFESRGTSHDLNPTMVRQWTDGDWHRYLYSADETVRSQAKKALENLDDEIKRYDLFTCSERESEEKSG